MAKAQGIVLYNEFVESLEKLPPEDVKSLVINGMRYNKGKALAELTPIAEMFWPLLAASIDHNNESYEKRCQINREIAEKRKKSHKEKTEDAQKPAAREDVLFSQPDNEQMNHNAPAMEDCTPNETERRTDRCDGNETNPIVTNGDHMDTIRYQHNITETKTETETQTETQTETKTEAVTKPEPELQPKPKPEPVTEQDPSAQDGSGNAAAVENGDGDGVEVGNGDGSGVGFRKPTLEEIRKYCMEYALLIDADAFYRYYEARGWCVRGEPIQSWRSLADRWQKLREDQRAAKHDTRDDVPISAEPKPSYDLDEFVRASMERSFDFDRM